MSRILTLPGLKSLCCAVGKGLPQSDDPASSSKQSGFSMVELMVTMAILIIIIVVAVPQFQMNGPTYEANGLYSDIEFARSSAVKLGQPVVVCASADGATCSSAPTGSAAWTNGWIVIMAIDGLCSTAATGGQVLRAKSALTSNDTATFIQATGGTNNYYCFNRLGYTTVANNGMVSFNTSSVSTQQKRCVSVAGVGHGQVLTSGKADFSGMTC